MDHEITELHVEKRRNKRKRLEEFLLNSIFHITFLGGSLRIWFAFLKARCSFKSSVIQTILLHMDIQPGDSGR